MTMVQLYLFLFSLHKMILEAKKVRKDNLKSLVSPWDDPDRVETIVGKIKGKLPTIIAINLPRITTIPLYQGMTWMPSWKALPTHKLTQQVWTCQLKLSREKIKHLRSSLTSLPYELEAFQFLLVTVHAYGKQWSQGCLWNERIRYALDKNNKLFTPTDLDWFEKRIGPLLPSCNDLGVPPVTGRLGCS